MSVYDHLEYRHLKYVVAVAETGSMSAAAARLHVSLSAISEQISGIEEIFEIQIFERKPDGCTLTAEGRVLFTFALASLEDREHIVQTLRAIRAGTLRPLRLGFSPFVEKSLLEAVTETYRHLLPGCEILPQSEETDELALGLRGDSLDAAIVTLPIDTEELRVKVLERERLVVCLRRDDPLAGDVAISPAALDGKLSIFDYQHYHPAAYARIVEMLDELGIAPRSSTSTMNGEHIQWMVKEGMGYALVRAGRPLIEGLVSRPIAGAHWTIDSALISKAGKQHPALPLLVRELAKRIPSGLEIVPKTRPMAWRTHETATRDEDQMKLVSEDNAPDDRRKEGGLRPDRYRHRK